MVAGWWWLLLRPQHWHWPSTTCSGTDQSPVTGSCPSSRPQSSASQSAWLTWAEMCGHSPMYLLCSLTGISCLCLCTAHWEWPEKWLAAAAAPSLGPLCTSCCLEPRAAQARPGLILAQHAVTRAPHCNSWAGIRDDLSLDYCHKIQSLESSHKCSKDHELWSPLLHRCSEKGTLH